MKNNNNIIGFGFEVPTFHFFFMLLVDFHRIWYTVQERVIAIRTYRAVPYPYLLSVVVVYAKYLLWLQFTMKIIRPT